MANEIRQGIRTLNLSATQLKDLTRRQGSQWSDELINDYLTILQNVIALANEADDVLEKVSDNTDNIAINVTNIETNKENIEQVEQDLSDHVNSNSQHGVTGVVVGTEDFPTELVGGAVKRSELVDDVAIAATQIGTADVGAAPAAYSQAYAQQQTGLINEEKAKINTIVTDLQTIRDEFNDLLAKAKTAEQMTS